MSNNTDKHLSWFRHLPLGGGSHAPPAGSQHQRANSVGGGNLKLQTNLAQSTSMPAAPLSTLGSVSSAAASQLPPSRAGEGLDRGDAKTSYRDQALKLHKEGLPLSLNSTSLSFRAAQVGVVSTAEGEDVTRLRLYVLTKPTFFDWKFATFEVRFKEKDLQIVELDVRCLQVQLLNQYGKIVTDLAGKVSHPIFKTPYEFPLEVMFYAMVRLVDDSRDHAYLEEVASYHLLGEQSLHVTMVPEVGVAELMGHRNAMEDRVASFISEEFALTCIGVFDGHGGAAAAELASQLLRRVFLDHFSGELLRSNRSTAIRYALVETFRTLEESIVGDRTMNHLGTTACVVVVDVERHVLHAANVGDTRAILARRGRAEDLSRDHKASDPYEVAQVYERGGFIARGRALGQIMITRALGDAELKRYNRSSAPISAQPDVTSLSLSAVTDDFAVIACDGVFDVMSSQQVVNFIKWQLVDGAQAPTPVDAKSASMRLISHCSSVLNSLDNVTCAIVKFNWRAAPPPSLTLAVGDGNIVRQKARASALRRHTSSNRSSGSGGGTTGTGGNGAGLPAGPSPVGVLSSSSSVANNSGDGNSPKPPPPTSPSRGRTTN